MASTLTELLKIASEVDSIEVKIAAGFGGLEAAKDYLKDYSSDPTARIVHLRLNVTEKAMVADKLWPGGAPVTKLFSRNPKTRATLSGTYYGVAYQGLRSGAQMLDVFDERNQRWLSFEEPVASQLLEGASTV
jgi:hypothetical protein